MIQKLLFITNRFGNYLFKLLKYDKDFFSSANAQKYIFTLKNTNKTNDIISKREPIKNLADIKKINLSRLNDLYDNFFKVDINKICSDTGRKIYDEKFPLFKTSIELIENKLNYDLDKTFIYQFLKNFVPKNYAEVFRLKNNKNILPSLSQHSKFYPWMHSLPQRHQFAGLFGFKKDIFVEMIILKLINLIHSFNKFSYIPSVNDSIMGYLMIKKNDYRFVITAGIHRTSVFLSMYEKKKLDIENLIMKFDNYRIDKQYYIIDINKINLWPAVKKGYISREEATEQFNSYFL